MPPVPEDIFMSAVKDVVLANAKWVPPFGKGSLYLRPLIIGTGPVREYVLVACIGPLCAFQSNLLDFCIILVLLSLWFAARRIFLSAESV